jgi:hypothetical protein
MGDFLNPVNGARGEMERKGLKPRDHARDNIVALRELQHENREKQAQQDVPPIPEWKMQKFKQVKSKIAEEGMNKRQVGAESREHNTPPVSPRFLRRGSLDVRLEKAREEKLSASPRLSPRQPMKAPVPKVQEVTRLAPRRHTDFVEVNRKDAIVMSSPRKAEPDQRHRHHEFGQVPTYIQERKERMFQEEERRKAAMPDPNCPPGMVLMPDSERVDTLRILDENEKETMDLLFKLPLYSTTPSILKRRELLEGKLREIESARKLFSKERVYIQG